MQLIRVLAKFTSFLLGSFALASVGYAQPTTDSLRLALSQNMADSGRITTLIALAKAYRNQVPDSAISIGQRALNLARSTNNLLLEAAAWRTIGAGYYFKGDYKGAATQEMQALAIFRQLNDTVQVAMSENNIGSNFLNLGIYDSALVHLALARRQFRSLGDTAKEIFVANNIGIILTRQANYPGAMRTYLEALKIAELYKDDKTKLLVRNNIAVIHEKQGNWGDALAIYVSLLDSYQTTGNKVQEALTLNNLGVVYDKLEQPQQAQTALIQAIALYQRLDNKEGVARAKSNLGSQIIKHGKAEAAIPMLLEANQYFSKYGNKSGELRSTLFLANAYIANKKFNLAEQYGKRALNLYNEIGEAKLAPEVFAVLHKVYAFKGDYEKAYNYHQRYKQVADSLFNLEKTTEINRLAYLHQMQENRILHKTDSLQQAQLATQHAYFERSQLLLAWITLAALLLGGLVMVYFLKDKKIKQAYRALSNQNLEIVRNREDIKQQALQLREAYEEIRRINENLEAMVLSRTEELENKNRQLEEYAFLNAHKLRAPVARLIGLIHVAKLAENNEELRKLMMLSQNEALEVDRIVRKIGKAIQNGVPLDRWGLEE